MHILYTTVFIYNVFYMFRTRGFTFRKMVAHTVPYLSIPMLYNTLYRTVPYHTHTVPYLSIPMLYNTLYRTIHILYHICLYRCCTTHYTVPHTYCTISVYTDAVQHTIPYHTHTVPYLSIPMLYNTLYRTIIVYTWDLQKVSVLLYFHGKR